MACLDMYNNSQTPPPMSPRISFSNDFVESHHNNSNNNTNFSSIRSELPPPSSDFEFSVTNYNRVTSADELFFKGRFLPYEGNNIANSQMQRTLRDELLVNDDEGDFGFSLKPPKGSSSSSSSSSNRWKGFLGLRKSHLGSKKPEKHLDVSTFDSGKRFSFSIDDPNLTKSPQEMMSKEGPSPSSNDMEMGI